MGGAGTLSGLGLGMLWLVGTPRGTKGIFGEVVVTRVSLPGGVMGSPGMGSIEVLKLFI